MARIGRNERADGPAALNGSPQKSPASSNRARFGTIFAWLVQFSPEMANHLAQSGPPKKAFWA
jgi:hypothetical protein